MEIKNIIDKPLIFIEEGKISKLENKIVVDKNFKKIYYLKTLIDGFPYYLNIKKIYSIGLDAIVIKSINSLKNENDFELLPNMFMIDFDSKIYTYLGDYVTKINNIEINKDFLITKLMLEKEINLTKIISSGEKIIIIDDTIKKMRKPATKKFPENKKSNDQQSTTITFQVTRKT